MTEHSIFYFELLLPITCEITIIWCSDIKVSSVDHNELRNAI